MNGTRSWSSPLFAADPAASRAATSPALLIRGTVDSTREFADERGTQFADPEMVGPVIAAGTVTNEGFIYFVPDYEPLLMARSSRTSPTAWAGCRPSRAQAELAGDFDKAEKLNQRSGILFARALFYAKRMLRLRDDDFDAAIAGGLDEFKRWVDENFYEKEDAEVLLIAGLGFLVPMIQSEEGLAAAVDLPYARYMIERSIELDPELERRPGR